MSTVAPESEKVCMTLHNLALRRVKAQPPQSIRDALKFKDFFVFHSKDDERDFIVKSREYLRRRHYLSTKQIPSCMSLRKAGNPATKANAKELQDLGVPLQRYTQLRDPTKALPEGIVETLGSWINISLPPESQPFSDNPSWETASVASTQGEPLDEEDTVDPLQQYVYRNYKLSSYEDIFQLIATSAQLERLTGENFNSILVLQADLSRINEPLPRWLAGPYFTGGKRFSFVKLYQVECLTFFLIYHTHWGYKLHSMIHAEARLQRDWARKLWFRLLALLQGQDDPDWTESEKEILGKRTRKANPERRKHRFLEVLKTIDGMFIQRWLTHPVEHWTWDRYDLFVLTSLSDLIGDEFLDGLYDEQSINTQTAYEILKKIRGELKRALLSNTEMQITERVHWSFLYLFDLFDRVRKNESRMKRTVLTGILIQKRGCGQPPAIISSRAKVKFLKLISTPYEPLTPINRAIVQYCVDTAIRQVPDAAFTGLVTKATLRVTTAACWEETQQNGGTLSALHQKLAGTEADDTVPIRDLFTGKIVQMKKFSDCTIGEFMFWRCLHHIIRHPLHESTRVMVVKVEEPGKTRIATKGSAYAKVVLDVINKLCSYPLVKVQSSQSGMSLGNHGWRFFRATSEEYMKDLFFNKVHESVEENSGEKIKFIDHQKPFISSTDYETATDNFDLEISKIISTAWMTRCGLPPYLIGIYNALMYTERHIHFAGEGIFQTIGEYDEKVECRYVILRRGLLMGDPLTKVQLHVLNMSVRAFANIQDESPDILAQYFTNPSEIQGIIAGIQRESP